MKLFRNITIGVGVVWLLCVLVVLISKLKSVDEMFMSFCIISMYLFTLMLIVYVVIFAIIKIKSKLKQRGNIDYSK